MWLVEKYVGAIGSFTHAITLWARYSIIKPYIK